MANALNMTMRLKQDAATKAKVAHIKSIFASQIQPTMEKALRDSEIVHFARVLIIGDQYIQVITEFDGDKQVYTDFFRKALPDVFRAIFDLVDGAPPWDELNDADAFYAYSKTQNLRALGDHPTDPSEGYLFAALGETTIKQIRQAMDAKT
jgi:hypothetical protein